MTGKPQQDPETSHDAGGDQKRSNDPFALLGLEPRFDLAHADIERAFLTRAAMAHPDLAPGDAVDAATQTARLTSAKAVLTNPEKRANALLEVLGGPSKEADRSLPDGFLMEIMSVRERIEADAADPTKRAEWEAWAEDERRQRAARIAELFNRADTELGTDTLGTIRTELNAWRYIERLIEQLDPDYDPGVADFL